MPYVIARHRVEDYARWKRVFDESEARMREAGVKSRQVFRNRDDPNELALLIEVDDLEQAGRWTRSEEFQAIMQRGGVRERTAYLPEG
jgi:uncharacterized protein (DUF1330 family)